VPPPPFQTVEAPVPPSPASSRMPGSVYSARSSDSMEEEKKAAQRTSIQLFYACITGFVGSVFFLMSFASPYWLASWADTQSPFLNMGLWEFCFDRFRFPKNQYDRMFDGCAPIWGTEYREIREWMTPWWLMLVQLMAALSFMLIFLALIIDACLLLRMPMEHVLRFEANLVYCTFIMKAGVTVLLFLCVALFGGMCWDREWLLYPNYNYPSWSYALACFAMLIHGGAAFLMFLEAVMARERKQRNAALLMQMYPTDSRFGAGSLSTYHGSGYI